MSFINWKLAKARAEIDNQLGGAVTGTMPKHHVFIATRRSYLLLPHEVPASLMKFLCNEKK